ncbi:hypothetical protein BDZ45DRAFT_683806 [Acephala macrosclerotiorum]|nr:hypothetical protein BDZ45DRAFT_683806 [Acephala macrosclerotiorum]
MSDPTTSSVFHPATQYIRGQTPVSPLSEELFGDILDAPPRTTPLPADLCWIFEDSEEEEEPPTRCKPPQLHITDSDRSPSPPPVGEVLAIMSRALSARPSLSPVPSKYQAPTEKERVNGLGHPLQPDLSHAPTPVQLQQPQEMEQMCQDKLRSMSPIQISQESNESSASQSQVSEVPLDRSPLFCSPYQQILTYGGPPGEAIDPQSFISQFMEHMALVPIQPTFPSASLYNTWAPSAYLDHDKFALFNVSQPQGHLKSQISTSHTEPVFEALSKAPYVFEVEMYAIAYIKKDIDGRRIMERREVELSRYFLPMKHGYLEIHAKDVCAGLNPVRERLGQMDGISPFLVYGCKCPREVEINIKTGTSDECHTSKRTVFLLKNRLIRGTFGGRRARVVTGEWLVGGVNKQWGMLLNDAKEIWAVM